MKLIVSTFIFEKENVNTSRKPWVCLGISCLSLGAHALFLSPQGHDIILPFFRPSSNIAFWEKPSVCPQIPPLLYILYYNYSILWNYNYYLVLMAFLSYCPWSMDFKGSSPSTAAWKPHQHPSPVPLWPCPGLRTLRLATPRAWTHNLGSTWSEF